MSGTLENLLQNIRDGLAASDAISRARALIETDPRVPDELRAELLVDDPAEDAAVLLALLGGEDPLGDAIADAIRWEAGLGDGPAEGLTAEERAALDAPLGFPLEAAVRAAAGELDVWPAVSAALQPGSVVLPIGDALRAAAGTVDVWPAVSAALQPGSVALPIGDALRAAAGTVDVLPAVIAALQPAPVAAPVIPAAANNTRWWVRGLVLLAAAALLTVAVWRIPATEAIVAPPVISEELVFANVQDSTVVELSYGDDVNVVQVEGDQGALILWVDSAEEAP